MGANGSNRRMGQNTRQPSLFDRLPWEVQERIYRHIVVKTRNLVHWVDTPPGVGRLAGQVVELGFFPSLTMLTLRRISLPLGVLALLYQILPLSFTEESGLVEEGRALPNWLRKCQVPLDPGDISLIQQRRLTGFLHRLERKRLERSDDVESTILCQSCKRPRLAVFFELDRSCQMLPRECLLCRMIGELQLDKHIFSLVRRIDQKGLRREGGFVIVRNESSRLTIWLIRNWGHAVTICSLNLNRSSACEPIHASMLPPRDTVRSTNFSQFPHSWTSRLQLLFDWDDGFKRPWDKLSYRLRARRFHHLLPRHISVDAALLYRSTLGHNAQRYIFIIPKYDGKRLYLPITISKHHSQQRKDQLTDVIPASASLGSRYLIRLVLVLAWLLQNSPPRSRTRIA